MIRLSVVLPLAAAWLALGPTRARAQAASVGQTADTIVVPTARSPEELRQAGLRYQGAVRACYEQEGLRQDPRLAGSLEVGLTISPQGSVADISIDTMDVRGLGMREVAACVRSAAAHWHFSDGPFRIERSVLAFTFIAPGDTVRSPGAHGGAARLPPSRP
jgi:hypothetical protein